MKVRMRFTKLGKVKWTSHRDLARMWERAIRRVDLRLAYTQGFSPRPKFSFGLALPTGAESLAEYLDIDLDDEFSGSIDVNGLPALLTPALPLGIDVQVAAVIDDRAESLQHVVTSCSWTVEVAGAGPDELQLLVAQALAADTLVIDRERKGQVSSEDIRPGILSAAVVGAGEVGAVIACDLATQPRGLRPSELLRALGPQLEAGPVRRTHQWITCDGARREEPLPLGATAAPPASMLERAS